MAWLGEVLNVALAAAPWLLVGLFLAGLIRALVPSSAIRRWIGGRGVGAVSRAAIIGAPLPLCSCGAIPTAFGLHRGGAGRGPTAAFMISTPGVGADSVAISYVLLGPFMALTRAAGAITTAIVTGLLVARTDKPTPASSDDDECCGSAKRTCNPAPAEGSLPARLGEGMRYAFVDLLADLRGWLLVGVLIAGALVAFVPPQAMAEYGSGLVPMLLLAVVGIPIYLCATAATPIGAGMLLAGVSPGTVLVFLLAGPITSMVTLGMLRREMGNAAVGLYLAGILVTSVTLGLLTDQFVAWSGLNVAAQIGQVRELLPAWTEWLALGMLVATGAHSTRPVATRIARGRLIGTPSPQ